MKLNKFKKNSKLRNTLLTLGIISIILGGGIILYKTYALYQDNTKKVPNFGHNIKLAIVVDGEEQEDIPVTPLGKDNKYYDVNVKCTSSRTTDLWDYNAWKLNLNYIKSDSECNVEFTSNLTKEDYDKYIEAGVQTRRNTYRGRDITDYKKLEETDKMNLYKQIENCTFDDIYVGDYITGSNGVTWLIADLNNYLYSGDTSLNECHATIIPAKPLTYAQMNEIVQAISGYYNSNLVQKILGMKIEEGANDVLNKYIVPDFNGHIIPYKNLLSNNMDGTRVNQYGTAGGASSDWGWYSRYLDLMSEVNVYGSVVFSSSGYDIGIDNRQYAIFALKPEYINSYGTERFNYWLKAATYSTNFAIVDGGSNASDTRASGSRGIRPRFLIN